MKVARLPSRDRHENRFEREEKLGQALETLPGKTLRDRTAPARIKFDHSPERHSAFEMNIGFRRAGVMAKPEIAPVAPTARFTLFAPSARAVHIAGTFNNWHPSATPLARSSDGTWTLGIALPSGLHEYRYIVDGIWQEDPLACESVGNPYGSRNSVKRVG